MANLVPFRFSFKKRDEIPTAIKALTTGDDLQIDEQGRHLIFRNIGGRVTPIRVSAEDFAEWLKDQNVSINPADQKTLREIDRELEIMERAAEYGGPALQKQYEDYFKQRRALYTQMSSGYYQQALQNQAVANKMTVEQLQQSKQAVAAEAQGVSPIRRSQMNLRGWDSSFHMWIENQEGLRGLTPADDAWYYNRVYGVILSALIHPAKQGIPLSQINKDAIFSDEFILEAMRLNYNNFFGSTGVDPKKIVAAVEFMKKNFREDIRGNKSTMGNFIDYWYKRMEEDFSSEQDVSMESSPVTDAVTDVTEGFISPDLPKNFTQGESRALMGLYNKARGSKLHSAHRVLLHGMGRLVESIPLSERVPLAAELAHPKRGLHSLHREGYNRAYQDSTTLGLSYDREALLKESLLLMETASAGSTQRKLEALKRMSMIMGMMDGADVIEKNSGIQESQFSRRWHNSAVNAHRVKAEGPGILDVLLDDEARSAHTYTNQDLKLIHAPTEAEQAGMPEAQKIEKPKGPQDIGDGYSFSANKLMTPTGYTVEFSPTTQGHADITVSSKDGRSFEARVYMPPIGISKMTEEDRLKYLDSLKGQIGFMVTEFEKTNPPKTTDKEKEDMAGFSPEELDFSDATFRVPVFDFKEKLTHEDREFVGEMGRLIDEGGLEVDKVMDGIFKIKNPRNKKVFTIMVSKGNKKIVGIETTPDGKNIPHAEPNLEIFMHALDYRSEAPEKPKSPESSGETNPISEEDSSEPKPYDDPEGITVRSKNGTFKTPRVPGQERINPNRIFINFDKAIKPEDYDLIYGLGDLIGHGLDYEYTSKPGMYRVVNKDNTKYLFIDMDDKTGRIQTWLPGENNRIILQGNADLTSIIDELDFDLKPLPEYR
jgi:hypothetical protein